MAKLGLGTASPNFIPGLFSLKGPGQTCFGSTLSAFPTFSALSRSEARPSCWALRAAPLCCAQDHPSWSCHRQTDIDTKNAGLVSKHQLSRTKLQQATNSSGVPAQAKTRNDTMSTASHFEHYQESNCVSKSQWPLFNIDHAVSVIHTAPNFRRNRLITRHRCAHGSMTPIRAGLAGSLESSHHGNLLDDLSGASWKRNETSDDSAVWLTTNARPDWPGNRGITTTHRNAETAWPIIRLDCRHTSCSMLLDSEKVVP